MGERTWGRKYRNTVICVDSYANSVPVGTVANPFLPEAVPFHGTVQLLKTIETLLDEMHLPQSFTEKRSFSAAAPPADTAEIPPGVPSPKGRMATFSVNIIFRQNASWQGVVSWMDAKQEESFRSVLELLTLMDSALSA